MHFQLFIEQRRAPVDYLLVEFFGITAIGRANLSRRPILGRRLLRRDRALMHTGRDAGKKAHGAATYLPLPVRTVTAPLGICNPALAFFPHLWPPAPINARFRRPTSDP